LVNNKLATYSLCGFLSLCCFSSNVALAGQETLVGAKVEQIAGSDSEYTGCAAKLSLSVSLPSCTYPNYVHFDCDGSANSTKKSSSSAMFNLIQLAYVTDKSVLVVVNEPATDGVCRASYVNVF